MEPMLAFLKTPHWEKVDAETREAFAELTGALGDGSRRSSCFHRPPMPGAGTRPSWKPRWRRISSASGSKAATGSPTSCGSLLERGRRNFAPSITSARCAGSGRGGELDELFMERYDAILTPAAPGTAPQRPGCTGDPSFCTLWTLWRNAGAISCR